MQPWKKRSERESRVPTRKGKLFVRDNLSGREVKWKKTMKRNLAPNKKQEVKPFRKPKNLQQMGEDF